MSKVEVSALPIIGKARIISAPSRSILLDNQSKHAIVRGKIALGGVSMKVLRNLTCVIVCLLSSGALGCRHKVKALDVTAVQVTIDGCTAKPAADDDPVLHAHGLVPAFADTLTWINNDKVSYTAVFSAPPGPPFATAAPVIPAKNQAGVGSSGEQILVQGTLNNCNSDSPSDNQCKFQYKLQKPDGSYCLDDKQQPMLFPMHVKG